jgi:hypothetical protein
LCCLLQRVTHRANKHDSNLNQSDFINHLYKAPLLGNEGLKIIFLKKNLVTFGTALNRAEAKKITGGNEEMSDYNGGTGGKCYYVEGGGNSSCWYSTSSNSETLCQRVYPGAVCMTSLNNGNGACTSNCHMN